MRKWVTERVSKWISEWNFNKNRQTAVKHKLKVNSFAILRAELKHKPNVSRYCERLNQCFFLYSILVMEPLLLRVVVFTGSYRLCLRSRRLQESFLADGGIHNIWSPSVYTAVSEWLVPITSTSLLLLHRGYSSTLTLSNSSMLVLVVLPRLTSRSRVTYVVSKLEAKQHS